MVFTQTDGIVVVLHDHTHMRGLSVTRMRDLEKWFPFPCSVLIYVRKEASTWNSRLLNKYDI